MRNCTYMRHFFCARKKLFWLGRPNCIPRLAPWAWLPDLIKILFEPAGPNTSTRSLQAMAAGNRISRTKITPNGSCNGPGQAKTVSTMIHRFGCTTNRSYSLVSLKIQKWTQKLYTNNGRRGFDHKKKMQLCRLSGRTNGKWIMLLERHGIIW